MDDNWHSFISKDYFGRLEGPIEGRHQNYLDWGQWWVVLDFMALLDARLRKVSIDEFFRKEDFPSEFLVKLSFRVLKLRMFIEEIKFPLIKAWACVSHT